jgi:hypothetical protein
MPTIVKISLQKIRPIGEIGPGLGLESPGFITFFSAELIRRFMI